MPWTVDGLTLVVDQDDLTDLEVDVLDGSGTVLASESTVTDLAAGRIDVDLTGASSPRTLRLTFDRPSGVGTDLRMTDMWVDLADPDTDAATNP
jgi:hypothetical protein